MLVGDTSHRVHNNKVIDFPVLDGRGGGGGGVGLREAGTILILRGDSVIQVIFSTKKVANHKVIIIYLQGDKVVLFKHLRNSY